MLRHTLHDECRILLLHGVLHTLGYDHEVDEAGMLAMIAHEKALLAALGWQVYTFNPIHFNIGLAIYLARRPRPRGDVYDIRCQVRHQP